MPAAKSKTITEPDENKAALNEPRIVSESDDKPKTIGEFFQSIRMQKKLDIKTIAETLNISPRFIRAIETMDITQLPEKVYTLGFVRSYSKYLEIDPQKAVNTFRTQFYNDKSGSHDYKIGHPDSSTRPSRKITIVSLIVFSIIGLSWLVFDYYYQQSSLPFDSGIDLPDRALSRDASSAVKTETTLPLTEVPSRTIMSPSSPAVIQSKHDRVVEAQANITNSAPPTDLNAKTVSAKISEPKLNSRSISEPKIASRLRHDNQVNNAVPIENKISVPVTSENYDTLNDEAPINHSVDVPTPSLDQNAYGSQPNAD